MRSVHFKVGLVAVEQSRGLPSPKIGNSGRQGASEQRVWPLLLKIAEPLQLSSIRLGRLRDLR